jgi:hypothetical protein
MANKDTPFGARVVGINGAAVYSGRTRMYTILASDVTPLFPGDGVKITNNFAKSDIGLKFPVATRVGVGDAFAGVVVGFAANPDDLNHIYRKASTLRTAIVADATDIEVEIQTNGVALATDFGKYADITIGNGDPVFGTSIMELDQATISASTGQLQILRLSQRPENELGGFAKLICRINEHVYG